MSNNKPSQGRDRLQTPLHEQIRRELQRTSSEHHAPLADRPVSGEVLYKELSYAIVGACIEVHRHLGPGQLESNYERALASEFRLRGIPFERQVVFPTHYKEELVGEFVADMIVNNEIILELKVVERIHPVHRAQLLTYLRATGLRLGLLINFNEDVVWKGIKRIIY